MRPLAIVAAASLLALLVGCSAQTTEDSAGDNSALSGSDGKKKKIGEACGGDSDEPGVCEDGLECSPAPELDVGHCFKPAKLGEACGGDSDEPGVCAQGLECSPAPELDVGHCFQPAKLGEACGGDSDEPGVCGAGLKCSDAPELDVGHCFKEAQVGEACGGNGDEPIALCADGLECFEPSDIETPTCRVIPSK